MSGWVEKITTAKILSKYIELLLDKKYFTVSEMIEAVIQENSIFLEEGNSLSYVERSVITFS